MTSLPPDGNGYGSPGAPPPPPPPAPTSAPEAVLFMLGDIGVTSHWVTTPNGTCPLRGSRWYIRDFSRTDSKIPTYAIVLAVVFALLCLLGLLFLLIKEQQTVGYLEVTVQNENFSHFTQIPALSPMQVAQVHSAVYQAQSMAAAA